MGELQRELRRLRELRGLTQKQVAKELGYVPSAVSNWESKSQTAPRREAVEQLDKLYDARGGLISVWKSHTHGGGAPVWLRDDRQLSAQSVSIEVVTPVLVPGLLQSPLYARYALCEGRPNDPMGRIAELVDLRCSQLGGLSTDLRVFATFPESGLLGVPEEARREQAGHLLSLIGSDRVRVHLVPEGAILAGITSPFQIYQLHDGSKAAISDHTNGAILITETAGVTRLQDLARAALGSALPSIQTAHRLKELAA